MSHHKPPAGFTLIELSIVLVIIGLIVGGILTGRHLISAADVQGQMTQIQKYRTAANAFVGKFGALPGDIPEPGARSFGFTPRGIYAGTGDGNGVLDGINSYAASSNFASINVSGENGLFWRDLSTANLIDGSFTAAVGNAMPSGANVAAIATYLPYAKLNGPGNNFVSTINYNTMNVLQIKRGNSILSSGQTSAFPSNGLTVEQAYQMDKKLDDGLPGSGSVAYSYGLLTGAVPGTATSCYDNNNTAGEVQQYSITQNNGSGLNCTLQFKLQ